MNNLEKENILKLRKLLKNKSISFLEKKISDKKEYFIKHYNQLFLKGDSEFPGILELYSLLKTKKIKPAIGSGFLFKLSKDDARKYGKDIVRYFLVKNSDIFPVKKRAKISLDSYLELLQLSDVDISFINETKNFYYKKYNLELN